MRGSLTRYAGESDHADIMPWLSCSMTGSSSVDWR